MKDKEKQIFDKYGNYDFPTDIKQEGLNNATSQIEGILTEEDMKTLDRKTALMILQDLSKRMYSSLDLFGYPTLVIDRPKFEEVRKKYLDELPKDSVVLTREEYERLKRAEAEANCKN